MGGKIELTKSGQIEYTLKGNGPTILVMHGMSQDCDADAGYEAFINAGFSMLTPSRPGYGKTPASVGNTGEKAAEAMVNLLDNLKIKSVHIMAVSGGGPTAIYLAANYPEKVKKLALVSALSKPWLDKARYETVSKFYGKSFKMMWFSLRFFSVLFPRATAKQTVALFSTHDPADFMKHLSKQDIKSLLRLYKNKAYTEGPLIDLKSQPEFSVLNKITTPTLVVHSKEDKSVEFDNAEYAVQNIKFAELYISLTWSHFPWIGPHSDEELNRVIGFFKA